MKWYLAVLCGVIVCSLVCMADESRQFSIDPDVKIMDRSTSSSVPPAGVLPKTTDRVPAEKIITGVPGYLWRHGCGPTALGMVAGYFDVCGISFLFPGDASTQTEEVNQAIASSGTSAVPRHYQDYSEPIDAEPTLLPDRSQLPEGDEHLHDCFADYMRTSFSYKSNYYGWSWASDIGRAWDFYIRDINPLYHGKWHAYSQNEPLSWNDFKSIIDLNYPLVFLVDTDGNGGTDHFITVVGYRDNGGINEYGCLDTWAPADQIRWCEYRPIASGVPWGISWSWWLWLDYSEDIDLFFDDTSPDTNIGLTDDYSKSVQFLWFNQFTLEASSLPFQFNTVSIMFPDSGISIGNAIELAIYKDLNGGSPADAELIYTEDVQVKSASYLTFSEYVLSMPFIVNEPGNYLIGCIDRYVVSGTTPACYPALMDTDQSFGKSWVASWTGDPPEPPLFPPTGDLGTIDSFGLPGIFMIRASGQVITGPTPTPNPTPTSGPCTATGVEISMPSSIFHASDPCSCTAIICNAEGATLTGYPLFVILDIGGAYFFAPAFNDFSYYAQDFPPGYSQIQVLYEFAWPAGAGSYSGAIWYGAFTDPAITQLFGSMDTFEFGWSD